MAETVAKVVDDIVAKVGRPRRDGRISPAMVNEEIVMDGYPVAARARNETVIVRPFGMTLRGGFLDCAPLDRNTGGAGVNVDGLILRPGTGNMVEDGVINDRKLNGVEL